MATVKWAVWGSCGIAKRRTIPEGLVPADNAELVSVYDVDAQANAEMADKLGITAAASEAELLSSAADAVYIATPAYLHHEHVLAAVKAGKHVLCEKPLGMSNDQAAAMIAAAKSAGVQLGCALMMRFSSQHQAALKMIQDGKLGKMVYARAQLSCWYPPMDNAWRQNLSQGGGGSLMDLGGHCVDLLEMLLGPADKLACFTNNSVHGYESEDSATTLLNFASGAMATVDTFFCVPDTSSKNALELYGSGGSILATGTIGQGAAGQMTAYLSDPNAAYDADQARDAAAGTPIAPDPVNMYRAEVEEFSAAILDKRPAAIDAAVGLRSQKVLSACYESARTGKVIQL